VSVLTTAGIVISLIPPTVRFFDRVGIGEFFTGTQWAALFKPPSYGVLPLVSGTLLVTAIAVAVAVPVGLLTAIYLSEYAHARVRKTVKPVLEVLAGIPTVVFGFFALVAVTPRLQEWLPWEAEPRNALAPGLVMAVMLIPTVASLSEDAMSAVPQALRDGGFALGSSRMVVALRVVVPAALSGIVAAVILAISRAIGETMIVYIAFGARPTFTANPLVEGETMAAYIAQAGSGDLPVSSFDYTTIFAVGALLFALTFAMNAVSIRLVRKYREVYE
jgi:phosphate transport system permease protein